MGFNSNEEVKVSVITSVYNVKDEYLIEAIDSMLNQTFDCFEYILINDGSSTSNSEILKSYSKKDNRIRLIENPVNIGLTKSLNIGLKNTKGKYIARLDADDVSHKERLQLQFDYMEKHPEIDVLGSWFHHNNGKTMKTGANFPMEWRKVLLLTSNAGIVHSTAFIRSSFLKDNNIMYDETKKRAQDYKLWLDIALCGGVIEYYPRDLVLFRDHENQISQAYKDEQDMCVLEIRAEIMEKLVPDVSISVWKTILREDCGDTNAELLKNALKILWEQNEIRINEKKNNMYFEREYLRQELRYIYHKATHRSLKLTPQYMIYRIVRGMQKGMK